MRIAFDADADSLSVVGGIEDDAHGYSANIPVAIPPAAANARTKTSLASTGMMAGKQDPMMGFPENLRFEPYAYFRNIGDSAIHLSSGLYYDRNGKARSSGFRNCSSRRTSRGNWQFRRRFAELMLAR